MTVFESKAIINKPVDEVYIFLNDLNNHQQLMPDNITNWVSSKSEASFTIQNMANLSISITDKIENQSIVIAASDKAPFAAELKWTLSDFGNKTTQATFTLSAQLNMMMRMMASGPLQKLADQQTKQLQITFS